MLATFRQDWLFPFSNHCNPRKQVLFTLLDKETKELVQSCQARQQQGRDSDLLAKHRAVRGPTRPHCYTRPSPEVGGNCPVPQIMPVVFEWVRESLHKELRERFKSPCSAPSVIQPRPDSPGTGSHATSALGALTSLGSWAGKRPPGGSALQACAPCWEALPASP